MSDATDRLAVIREALKGVPVDDLQRAAATLGGPWGELLGRVSTALASDADTALEQALQDVPDPAVLERELAPLRRAMQDQVQQVQRRVDAMGGRLRTLRRQRGELAATVDPLRLAAADDAEVTGILDQAARLLGDEGPWDATDALVARLDTLVERLGALPQGRTADELMSVDLTFEAAELEREARGVETAARPLFEDVPALLDQAAELAIARGHAVAPAAAIQAARVWESLHGMDEPQVVARWQRAYDASQSAARLKAVWIAGKRLQADALRRDDHQRVAVLAHHMADLAYAQGARREAATARLEEAQCLARWPEHHAAARTFLTDAVTIAQDSGDRDLQLQAGLMHGQTLELLGDAADARQVYERALRLVDPKAPPTPLVGRISLQLGRLRASAGQAHRAGKHLELAHRAAVAGGDASLLVNAAIALVDLAVAQGDPEGGGALLRGTLARLAGTGVHAQLLEVAPGRWGQERVADWLGD